MNSQNVRLLKNTLAMYVRMLVTILIGLYASRLSLQILGVEDYGIYNIVGGVVSLFSFLSNSMAISVQRYYSIELGRKNIDKLSKIFSASTMIHSAIAILIFVLAEILGGYFIKEYLNIPKAREFAAFLTYQCVVFTIVINIFQVPFNGLIIVYEKLRIFAYIGIIESLLKLGLLLLLKEMSVDKLVWYAFFMFLTSLSVALFYNIYCRYIIKEVRFKFYFQKNVYREMFAFAGWTALGEIGWTFVSQGVNIILNLFFGPILNAARGISVQVQSLIMRFVQSFQTPLNPQIMKSYAAFEYNRTLVLFYKGTLYSYFLVLFIAIPLMFNMKYVLRIWLGNFPDYTVSFCRLTIIGFLLDTLGNLINPIMKANGNIRKFQILVSLILFLNFPFSFIVLKLGAPPYSILYIYSCISIIVLFVKLLMLRSVINFTIIEYAKKVLMPIVKVTCIYLVIPFLLEWANKGNIPYIIFSVCLTCTVGGFIIYFIGLSESDRLKVRLILLDKLKKIKI